MMRRPCARSAQARRHCEEWGKGGKGRGRDDEGKGRGREYCGSRAARPRRTSNPGACRGRSGLQAPRRLLQLLVPEDVQHDRLQRRRALRGRAPWPKAGRKGGTLLGPSRALSDPQALKGRPGMDTKS
eukprot:6231980-Pyramimonas_sp.AAC.1